MISSRQTVCDGYLSASFFLRGGNNLCANQFAWVLRLLSSSRADQRVENLKSTAQPPYVLHGRNRLVSIWRNAHAHAPREESSSLFLPVRDDDRVRYRSGWDRGKLGDGSAGRF